MNLTVEITSKAPSIDNEPNYGEIQFSCFDGEETMMVSFYDKVSVAHACFLAENVLPYRDKSAYAQLMRYIAETGFDDAEVGKVCNSED